MSTVEKALAQLQSGLISVSGGHSRAFQNLIRGIGEAKTRDEEDRIMRREVHALKELTAQPDLSPKQKKEVLVRLLYCEMLGHDVSFGHIHAVKFAQQSTLVEKRVGYLATSLFLHENHELTLLLVNSLQKDLESTNILVVCSALTVISRVIGADMVPVFVPLVRKKLTHTREIVRKKAVMTLHRFWSIAPSHMSNMQDTFRQILCDRDPGVMAASLHIFYDLVNEDPAENADLVTSFVSILKQIVEGRLPHDFDYHNMPSPWSQMKLLRILSVLGADDLKASESMYEVLDLALSRADTGTAIGYAVTYEVIRTITSIYPNSQLMEKAAKSLSRFLMSANNNYKYFGITLLGSVVQVDPQYAAEHQMVVINCLDDPDETLKRKTLDLLYHMTNPHNVEVICERLVSYLRSTVDDFLRADLVARVTELAERFAPSNSWFMQTMNAVFELGGNLVRPEVAHNLMRLLAEGSEDDDQDTELRLYAVDSYMELSEQPVLPDVLIKIMCWVLGEFSYLSEEYSAQDVLAALCSFLDRNFENQDTRGWVVTAVSKIVSQQKQLTGEVWARVSKYLSSSSVDIQQRCYELKLLASQPALMQQVLPTDASCEDLEVDGSLSFLDDFVSDALARGCAAYKPASQRSGRANRLVEEEPEEEESGKIAGLNVTPYAVPKSQAAVSAASALFSGMSTSSGPGSTGTATPPVVSTVAATTTAESTASGDDSRSEASSGVGSNKPSPQVARQASGLEVAGPRLWGRGGYSKKPAASPAVPVVTEPVSSGDTIASDKTFVGPSSPGEFGTMGKATASISPTSEQSEGGVPLTDAERNKRELAGAIFGGKSPAGRGAGILTGKGKTRNQKRRQQQQQLESAESAPLSQSNVASLNATTTGPAGGVAGGMGVNAAGPSAGGSLLDLDPLDPLSTMGSTPPVAGQNQAAGTVSADLLFNMDWGGASSVQPTVGSQQPMAAGSTGSAMGGPDLLQASPSMSATPVATTFQASGVGDLLGGLNLSNPAPSSSTLSSTEPLASSGPSQNSSAASGFSFLATSASPEPENLPPPITASVDSNQLPSDLITLPHSTHQEDVCNVEGSVRLSLQRVWKPDAVVFVFFLMNCKQTTVEDVKLQVQPPSFMQVEPAGAPSNWSTANVAGGQSARHILSLSGKTVAKTIAMKGEVSFREGVSPAAKRQFFNINISLSDLLRPLEISTAEFGKRWGATSHEQKTKVTTNLSNLQMYMDQVMKSLHIHPIEIIGTEAIAAGWVLGKPGAICLIHSKLVGGQLDLWVRTSSSLLTDCVVAFATSAFKS